MEMRWTQAITRAGAAVGGVVALALPLTAAMASAEPVAHAARTCNIASMYYTLGPTYVETLGVSRTSCATGVRVIKAYNRCRLNAGGKTGRCHSRVLGFRCSERRSSSSIQFIGKVRCTKGRAVVKFTYTENTT
jgi:hypothetical protein